MAEAPRPGPTVILEDLKPDIDTLVRFIYGPGAKDLLARWAQRDPETLGKLETALQAIKSVNEMVKTAKEIDAAELERNINAQSTALQTSLAAYMETYPNYLTTEDNLFRLLVHFANSHSSVTVSPKLGNGIIPLAKLPVGLAKICQIEGIEYAVVASFNPVSGGSISVYKKQGNFWYHLGYQA